ncbi:MAG: hypothetical protein AB1345_09230 [Chloroflexota bacterium]
MRYPVIWQFVLLVFILVACTTTGTQPASTTPPGTHPAENQTLTPGSPTVGEQPTAVIPERGAFAALTSEEKACLKETWGEQAYEEITTLQRVPTADEAPAMFTCVELVAVEPTLSPEQQIELGFILASHQVLLATSPDGLVWTVNDQVVRDHASAPEVVQWEDGTVMVYFVDGEKEELGAVRQNAEGGWEVVELVWGNDPAPRVYAPDIVWLPDNRLRMFYVGEHVILGFQPDLTPIYSAISSDGIHWEAEPGERIILQGITDPSVVISGDGRWLMALASLGQILFASSSDGDTFLPQDVTLTSAGVPELFLLPDGVLRLYTGGLDGFRAFVSSDGGQTWSEELAMKWQDEEGADPSVIQLLDGSWLMAWRRIKP